MKKNILKQLKNSVLICDGAMGTLLLQEGIVFESAPELLNVTHAESVKKIHKQYVASGANIITTNTFGASAIKLAEFDLVSRQEELITAAVNNARFAAGENVLVAGDVGPLGLMIEPLGELKFSEAVANFKDVCKYLSQAGVDVILLETMADIKEVKAAIIAAREVTDLPIWVQMTFDETGRTLYGTSPEVLNTICEGLGADIVGVNCSLGPKELLPVVEKLCATTNLYVAVQPNAGLPQLEKGETVYKLTPEQLGEYGEKFVKLGVNILGGCCGTTPAHIAELAKKTFQKVERNNNYVARFASRTKVVSFAINGFPLVIGERINPTARKKLTSEIIEGKTTLIKDNAREQVGNGADLLDLNVGVSSGNEAAFMKMGVEAIESVVDVPIVIDSTDAAALEAGLIACSGRPLINSVNGKCESMETVLPLAKKYGALVLILPVDEKGIPKKAAERMKVINTIVNKALELGIRKDDLVVDGLTLTVSTNAQDVKETLETLALLKSSGLKSVLGVSNISYGLPLRTEITAAFLSTALWYGLDMAIINPNIKAIMDVIYAGSVLSGRDDNASKFIKRAQAGEVTRAVVGENKIVKEKTIEGKLAEAILFGDKENIEFLVDTALKQGIKPLTISMEILIPALKEVGKKFEVKEYFLPQLILGAETMRRAFKRIKQEFRKDEVVSKGKIIMATVEGDVHDIGKNIVITILESYGYTIYDLGKNVTTKEIVEAAVTNEVNIVGLSALMTTTMQKMKDTVCALKLKSPKSKTILGGAVVTASFAKDIGADGYAKDALEAVSVVENLLKN